MATLIWTLLVLPLLLAAVSILWRSRVWTLWLPVSAAVVLLGVGISLTVTVNAGGPVTTGAGLLRVDALSAWMLAVVGAVAVVALWGGIPHRRDRSRNIGSFASLLCLFLAAMSLAVVADNIGLMWVAIELTTITTAFLVGSRGGRGALEAAWKYVVLGSVGVAIAFLGIALISAASRTSAEPSLSWVVLLAHAGTLDPSLTRAGAALAVLGFATKAGLAPTHSWLPDAHSQAPATVSGLMSGVLLSVAFYAILRVQAITDAALGPELMRGLLVTAGLLSLAVTAGLAITQKDFKRLLAYSSIEHMGLLALGAAAGGPLAIAAVLLHMLGHGLVKSSMFVLAGRILGYTGSHDIADVRNLLRRRPDLGGPFLLGAAALLGFPPFVTFFTEVAIIIAGFQRGLGWQMIVACALLLIVFAGIARHALAMTVGTDRDPEVTRTSPAPPDQPARYRQIPIVVALAVSAVIGFAAWPLATPLIAAVTALGGAR
jgi:hydrogenase-4 component F